MYRPAPTRIKSAFAAIFISLAMALAAVIGTAVPAQAGQAEMDLLGSYVGSWKGTGKLTGGDQPETFGCRMLIKQANKATKINYSGRCSLTFIPLNLGVQGTIYYSDKNRRYEGVMSSNTAFAGQAIGRKSGSTITFNFKTREKDDKGQDLTIGAKIILRNGVVTVQYEVEFNESGDKMYATVPFKRS